MAPSLKPAAHALAYGRWLRRDDLTREQQVAIFRRWVAKISVETNGFCNRTCWFCPNSFLNRHSGDLTMAPERWETFLRGLREVQYERNVGWSRFSEPLADRAILERLAEARAAAPRARLVIFSNGDYLNEDYLRELVAAGLNHLLLDAYLPQGAPFTREAALEQCVAIAARSGAAYETVVDTTHHVGLRLKIKGLEATVGCHDFDTAPDVQDRGGAMFGMTDTKPVRVSPCYLPSWHVVIDFNGAVMPCCNLRSDYPGHEQYIVARLGSGEGEVDLVEAYAQLAEWRRTLMSYGPKPDLCRYCPKGAQPEDPLTRLGQRLALGVASCTACGLAGADRLLAAPRVRRP